MDWRLKSQRSITGAGAGAANALAKRSRYQARHEESTSTCCFSTHALSLSLSILHTHRRTISVTRCWNKKLPNFFQKLPKTLPLQFELKINGFLNCPKSHQTFGLLSNENLLTRSSKNRPICSHCSQQTFCFSLYHTQRAQSHKTNLALHQYLKAYSD